MIKPLITIIGHCSSTSARIFCCTGHDPSHSPKFARIAWKSGVNHGYSDIQLGIAKPYETGVFYLQGLPLSATITYNICIAGNKENLQNENEILSNEGVYSFRLLPVGRPPRIVLLSCNGAYKITDRAKKFDMWPVLGQQIAEGKVDLIIHAGDQVYSDLLVKKYRELIEEMDGPIDHMLETLTEEYRRTYVEQSWSFPEVASVLASCPSVMMWDDHDIYDGWGSNDDDDTPVAQLFFKAARQAFLEFQQSHNTPQIEPGSFATAFIQSDVGFLVADARTHRMYKEKRVLGEVQMNAIRSWFMSQPASLTRIFLVLGIPPVHAKFAHVFTIQKLFPFGKKVVTDLRDTWLSPANRKECEELMDIIFDFLETHKGTEITILAGDVHVAAIGKIRRRINSAKQKTSTAFWQVTSSGIGSPPPSTFSTWIIKMLTRASHSLGKGVRGKLLPLMPDDSRVMPVRNFAMLHLDDGQSANKDGSMKVTFFAEGHPEPLEISLPSQLK